MGKASKWFRALLGLKKPDSDQPDTSATRTKDKRRWRFVKSYRENDQTPPLHNQRNAAAEDDDDDLNRHAIAVAAAAAEAVRMLNSGRRGVDPVTAYGARSHGRRGVFDLAAIKIQSAFRGYLARRALRALKALVRLQALVRGHIQRKRMVKEAQWMQSMMRVQARARAGRAHISEFSHSSRKSFHLHHNPGPPTPEKIEPANRARSGKNEQPSMHKRIGSKSNGKEICEGGGKTLASFNWSERRIEKEKSDKILEVDSVKPQFTPKQSRNLYHSDQHSHSFTASKDSHQSVRTASSNEVQSITPFKLTRDDNEAYRAAANSPPFQTSGRSRSPFTPSKSDGAASFLSDYCPNYMLNTESSKAKVRSLSAPKQRPHYDRSSPAKRHSMNGLGELRSRSAQRGSTLRASFTSKAYPGSGRLDRLGMPVGQRF